MPRMKDISKSFASIFAPVLLLVACSPDAPQADAQESPQDAFFTALSTHCGKAYAGQLVSEDEADADFVGAPMVMYVADCSKTRIAVPFHVEINGEWDRSRTWLITRQSVPHMSGQGETQLGLRLKHDHRHKDGESDALTMYGGDTADEGTATMQSFPVDQFSVDMFKAQGYDASVTNVWSVEVQPAGSENARFVYQLKRTLEGGATEPRLFRVEFDLSAEVEAPPPAWGHEGG